MDDVASRARRHPDLTVRIDDGGFLTYPAWVHRDVDRSQFVVHDVEDRTWAGCLHAVSTLIDDQLDAGAMTWRLHVFTGIDGVPGVGGPGHGCGAADLTRARWRWPHLGACGHDVRPRRRRGAGDQPAVGGAARAAGCGVPRGPRPSSDAGRRRRGKRSATSGAATAAANERQAVGAARPAHGGQEACRTRRRDGDGRRAVRRVGGAGRTPRGSGRRPVDARRRGADGQAATAAGVQPLRQRRCRPAPGTGRRCARQRIADDLAARRRRAAHPAMRAADLAFAATPAPLLRWGMERFDPDVRPPAVTGNTVVSSVNCGAADFAFGGAPVTLAAAFAGLSPMMGLTHVVVGVGDTVTIGVHAAESAVGGPVGWTPTSRASRPRWIRASPRPPVVLHLLDVVDVRRIGGRSGGTARWSGTC